MKQEMLLLYYLFMSGVSAGQCYSGAHCGQGEQCYPALAAPAHHTTKVLPHHMYSQSLN